jgi:uncharacterized protein (TIGR02246 family)
MLASGMWSFSVMAAPEPEAPLYAWVEAVESGKIDAIMALYDKDAIMISTFAHYPMTTREKIREYYKKVVANPDITVEITEAHPRAYGAMAVNTGQYTLSYTQEGEDIVIPARFTFTYVLRDDKWMIVDHHSSRVPLPKREK